jgi:hypothetical protein
VAKKGPRYSVSSPPAGPLPAYRWRHAGRSSRACTQMIQCGRFGDKRRSVAPTHVDTSSPSAKACGAGRIVVEHRPHARGLPVRPTPGDQVPAFSGRLRHQSRQAQRRQPRLATSSCPGASKRASSNRRRPGRLSTITTRCVTPHPDRGGRSTSTRSKVLKVLQCDRRLAAAGATHADLSRCFPGGAAGRHQFIL